MVRAAQASPDHGFCGVRAARAGDPSCFQGCARRQEPPSRARVRVGQWGSQRAQQRTALPASPRVTRSAPMAWALRARAPVAAGSLPRATRSAPRTGALRARAPTCALRVTAHVVFWGGSGDVEDVVRCALLESEARCKACFELLPRARVGWHTARTSVPPPPPRSSGAPVRWLMARGRRASGIAAAPRSPAAGAPATGHRRAPPRSAPFNGGGGYHK